MFAFADPSDDPIAGPIDRRAARLVGARRRGLDRLVADFGLDGLTYYYRGLDGNEAERIGAGVIVGNSLLTARGIPTSGEGDLKTNLAQLILDRLGAGGSYTEFYALDFDERFVLMGHDGPGHVAIAQERPTLRALQLYHGKRGAGLSVEFKVRYGPITIVGCTQTADGRAQAARRRGRVDPGRDVPDRQHEQPAAVRAAARRVLRALVRAGPDPPRRARRRPRRRRRAPRRVDARPRVRRGGVRWSASASCCGCGPTARRVPGAAPGGLAGDARRAAASGWGNYSLFLRDDGLLVGYLETDDFAAAQAAMEATDVNARWQAEMAEFFELPSGDAARLVRLEEIFHVD